jgi:hypothetical protein
MKEQSSIIIERTFAFNSINKVGGVLKAVGLNPFNLNADKIIAKAVKKAEFKGDLPKQLVKGLRLLVDSVNSDSKANSFGELAVKSMLERTFYNRLKVEQVLAKDPTIEQQPIERPIFIIGMPRTGTTILHAMMHEDTSNRSPLCWECLIPYPVPQPENFEDNPQLRTIAKEFDQLFKLVPDFKKKHHMEVDSPQECLGINMLDMNSFQTSAQVYIPSYMDWFLKQSDQTETMRFHKRFLQYLQSGGVKGERWLLKSPIHLMRLKDIFEVYPDACIIMTHRAPSKVVPSASSLIASVRSLYSDHEDLKRTGKEQAALWNDYFNRFLTARKDLDKESQILDLRFEDFVSDQVGTIQKIYTHFGWDLKDTALDKMKNFLAQNPKDKHGAHEYSLEDFGLTEQGINEQFSNYIHFLEKL